MNTPPAPAELATVKGSELVGLKYEPMFKYFADREESFVVCEDNYVTNDSGTGIVHQVGIVSFRVVLCLGVGVQSVNRADQPSSELRVGFGGADQSVWCVDIGQKNV